MFENLISNAQTLPFGSKIFEPPSFPPGGQINGLIIFLLIWAQGRERKVSCIIGVRRPVVPKHLCRSVFWFYIMLIKNQ